MIIIYYTMKKKILLKNIQDNTNKYAQLEEEEIEKEKSIEKEKEITSLTLEEKENQRLENIARVKQRIQTNKDELRTKRISKNNSNPKNNQLEALKKNPLFADIQNAPPEEIKKAVELMVGKMTNDSKQKKNAKKQINNLLEQLKKSTING